VWVPLCLLLLAGLVSCLEVVHLYRFIRLGRLGFLLAVGLQEGVKDRVGKYCMVVIKVAVGCIFNVNVKS